MLLTPTLSEGIKRLAQLADVPVRSVVLAAHLRVLALLSNQTDILTGVVANGRPETRDAERTLGLFLNTIPFRLHVSGGSWLDLVRATFSAEQEILPYRRYPLADIQRLLGGGSLFETLFSFNHFHVYQGMQRLTSVELLESTFFEETNFTLAANFGQEVATGAVKLELDYDAAILHEEQLEAIASYYLNTLTAMVNVPSARYEIQVLLPEHEMDVVLWRGHQAAELRAESRCLHQLFEAQVERAPDAAALVHAGHTLSYHRLNQLANQLAAFLQMSGVGPEVLVGVCLPRGFDWVVALLAVLKAGGVYVPLDPAYPEERLSWMVQDACLTLVLTQRPYMQRLPHSQARLVLLDEDERCWSQASAFSPRGSVAGENAAYLIYTSGSTGVPKGVLIPHKAIATHVALLMQRCALQATDRLLQFSALNFDVAMEELFSALGSGATCILSPFAALSTLPDFQHLLADEAVTVLNLPASYWHEWVAYCSSYSLHISSYVREVIVGSEAVAPRSFSDWQRLQSHPVRLFNAYGLTETTITTLMYEPESEYSYEGFSSIPLGYPLPHSQVYLLDVHLQPVPLGVVGEIYIGGTGVARGYLRRPELTAERFLPHPFSTQPGARVYKTGDLARYLPDGSLLFVGRSDLQLKLRGFRIEPAEIEAMLQLHSALSQAVVMVRTDTDGQQHLVAYLVAARQSSPPPPVSAISQFLAERLPSYLLPSAYVWLEELPLTSNGKIDRRALAQLTARSAKHPSVSATYVPPQNTLEAQLLQIWQKVLHLERIGMQDNFFELGGHSLLLVQLHSRLKHELGLQASILELFEYPTIRALAAHFKRKGAESGAGQGKKRGEARRAAVQQQTDLRQRIARSGNEGR